MRIEKEYRILEGIDEIRIFDATENDFYKPTPQEFDIEDIPISELINNIHEEVHALIPHKDGQDFIIQNLSSLILNKYNWPPENVKGRLLSKFSPLFFNLLHEDLLDVYKTRNTKKIRFVYYTKNKLTKLSNVKIVFDMERIFVVSNNIDTRISKREDIDNRPLDEEKTAMMESFSQTGSYYNINGKYTWSQGIYNILNRAKEESDDYYNIVLDLVIPEDKHIVDKIFETTNKETSQCEEIIRIMTEDNVLKVIEVNIYSYFDESGIIIRQGMINDITQHHHDENSKPVDFLLGGFKNSRKIALLIEPLNKKQYEFSKGFYYLIEKDHKEYIHSPEILDNIVEKDVVERIKKLIDGELSEIDETLTYEVDGNPNNKKIVHLSIERFEFENEVHSLGFLTNLTEEMEKHNELVESHKLQLILLKEIHHRVKNNLQIITSFLNLEKRAYRNEPDLIIENMLTRLSSLSLLHENTFDTKDFKSINLKEYILNHDMKTKRQIDAEIEFETYVDENLNITMEVITPLLLIIDELTMDSIKYATPNKTAPNKITKKITKSDDNTASLVFKYCRLENEDSQNATHTIRCEIIKSLTKQLNGTISLTEDDHETTYKLTFPTDMEHTIH